MKVVLWGLHEAGYRALRYLFSQRHEVFVVTENAPGHVPSVIELARSLKLPLLVAPSTDETAEAVSAFKPDLGISMYYAKVIPNDLLQIPTLGSYNFHPSLLPKHRGCFSAPWAIIDDDTLTGVSCHKMVEAVDRGPILCQSSVPIADDETAYSLYHKLTDSALDLLKEALIKAPNAAAFLCAQSGKGSYHKRAVPHDGLIDPAWSDEQIDRFVRALYFPPYPPAQIRIGEHLYDVETFSDYQALKSETGKGQRVKA